MGRLSGRSDRREMPIRVRQTAGKQIRNRLTINNESDLLSVQISITNCHIQTGYNKNQVPGQAEKNRPLKETSEERQQECRCGSGFEISAGRMKEAADRIRRMLKA